MGESILVTRRVILPVSWFIAALVCSSLASDLPETGKEMVSAEKEPIDREPSSSGREQKDADASHWIDGFQSSLESSIETTARWFDGFFGGHRYDNSGESYGRLISDLYWQDREGFDLSVRVRARYSLPGVNSRVNAIVGRGDIDQMLNDYESDFTEVFPASVDDDWLLGLGYSPTGVGPNRISFGGGVSFSSGVQPFVRVRYNFRKGLSDRTILSLRPTAFWRNDDGFGGTINLDLEHQLGDRSLIRLASWWEQAQYSDGIRFETYVVLYHQLSPESGVSLRAGFHGEEQWDPTYRDYGFLATYRQKIAREWFFFKLMAGLSWLRPDLQKERRADLVLGVGFELNFGRHPAQDTYEKFYETN